MPTRLAEAEAEKFAKAILTAHEVVKSLFRFFCQCFLKPWPIGLLWYHWITLVGNSKFKILAGWVYRSDSAGCTDGEATSPYRSMMMISPDFLIDGVSKLAG